MGFRAKLAEKAAEQVAQAAAKEIGKHVSKKAVDHAVGVGKKKIVSVYSTVREEVLGDKPAAPESVTLSPFDCQLIKDWADEANAFRSRPMTTEERDLYYKIVSNR